MSHYLSWKRVRRSSRFSDEIVLSFAPEYSRFGRCSGALSFILFLWEIGMLSNSWVDRFLKPTGACHEAVAEARQYPDAQTAWNEWKSSEELFWTLIRMRASNRMMEQCAWELLSPVKHCVSYYMLIDGADRWQLTEEDYFLWVNIRRWKFVLDQESVLACKAIAKIKDGRRSIHRYRDFCESINKSMVHATLSKNSFFYVPCNVSGEMPLRKTYERWMCDTIRKHFPKTPLLHAYL